MNGPRIGAVSITDRFGVQYKVCPICDNAGCPACNQTGRVRLHPVPVSSFRRAELAPAPLVPGHVNHLAPAENSDLERTWQIDLDGDGKVA